MAEYVLSNELHSSLEKAFKESMAAGTKTTRSFEGEIIVKGTNLYRGEYSECSVMINGFISNVGKTVNVFEGKANCGCASKDSPQGFTIPFNRHNTFKQLKYLLCTAIAYHEAYEI